MKNMKINSISFKFLSSAYAVLCLVLAGCLLFAPELIYRLFGIVGNLSADILSRRAAMLFLGFTVLAFLSRNAPFSDLRQSVTVTMGVTMFALLCTGLFEWFRGTIGAGIWVAIVGEAVFVIWSALVWRQGQTKA